MSKRGYKTSRRLHWALTGLIAIAMSSAHIACAGDKAGWTAPQANNSAGTVELAGLQDRFGQVAEHVTPSIVAISSVGADVSPSALILDARVDGPQLAAALDRVSRTVGTGFIIDADGYILTAEHVVSDAEQIWITTDDQKVYPAMVVGSDPRSDLAVLKICATDLKPVKFASPGSVKRGHWALTLGNPYGLATGGELAMSVGVVSATDRSLARLSAQENRLYSNLIQTTAEINPGNSGGPLFDIDGRVIGINAAVVLPQKNTNGIGFAFAVTDELLQKVRRMKAGEPIQHAYLGVSVSNTTINGASGARIDSVLDQGPSATSDLQVGDVVTAINGVPITGSDLFAATVNALPVGKSADIRYLRSGHTHSTTITTGARPPARTAVTRANQKFFIAGLLVGAAPEGMRVRSISQTSPYRKQGLEEGALITGVNGNKARSLQDLLAMLSTPAQGDCHLDLSPRSVAVR